MSDYAIQTKGIWKQYRIQQDAKPRYNTLRDQVARLVSAPFHRNTSKNELPVSADGSHPELKTNHESKNETIWALKDVDFLVKPGEVVGVIGRNGAGKSTLLKVLTRITDPTRGAIDIYGRIGSLLEVGTGFHKELTGRENVYLNGAILGMRKVEIDRKFDEIVAFSEVEKFIDTPVKFYSSGMQVRLAFAVAAHLEPEILLVDEVLAVGDASFQKKCITKMEAVGRSGHTVLFVSHNMSTVTRLCQRAVLLEQGELILDGPADKVVGEYLSANHGAASWRNWENPAAAPGNNIVRLRSVRIKRKNGETNYTFDIREPVGIEMEFDVLTPGYVLFPYFSVLNEEDLWLFTSLDNDPEWLRQTRPAGRYRSTTWIPGNYLAEGTFVIAATMRTEQPHIVHFHEYDVVAFQVVDTPDGDGARLDYPGHYPGLVRPLLEWETEFTSNGAFS